MRTRALTLLAAILAASGLVPAHAAPVAETTRTAAPSPGGESSENVEWLRLVPFDAVTATGASLIPDHHLIVTSWRNFSIYDIKNAEDPQLVTTRPFGFAFENEDVSTNGEIMLFSESLPRSILHVWDIEDKSNPVEIATLPGAGDHTATCILDCKYAYGSDGSLVDLREPSKPELVGDWHELIGLRSGVHDVDEFKPGFVIVSTYSEPLMLLDVRNPLEPKVLARGQHPAPNSWIFHSARWPNHGTDRFLLMEGEGDAGPLLTYDTRNWKKTKTFDLIDSWAVKGSTASSHWFEPHPDFDDGGLVTIGWYGAGSRFIEVMPSGKMKEVGWFEPHAVRSGFSSYWITDDIVYAVDLYRGIDVLRYHHDR